MPFLQRRFVHLIQSLLQLGKVRVLRAVFLKRIGLKLFAVAARCAKPCTILSLLSGCLLKKFFYFLVEPRLT